MIKFYMFFLMFAASAMDSGKIPSVWEMLRGHFGSDVCNSVERDVKEDGFIFVIFGGKTLKMRMSVSLLYVMMWPLEVLPYV